MVIAANAERWQRFRSQQRGEIASAIVEAVHSGPVDGLNVTEIVEVVGISRKTFYKYFDSLATAMVFTQEWVLAQITAHADHAVDEASTGLDRLLGRLYDFVDVALETPKLIQFVNYFDYTFRGSRFPADQRTAYEAAAAALYRRMTVDYADGLRDGSIRTGADADVVIAAVGNSVIGLVQRLLIIQRIEQPAAAGDAAYVRLEVEVWRRFLSAAE